MTPEEKIAADLAAQAATRAAEEAAAAKKIVDDAAAAAVAKAAEEAAALAAKNRPSDAEAKLIREVMEKKAALKVAQDAQAAAEAKLKDFDGLDPVEIKALAAAKKAADDAALAASGNWDRLKAQMAEVHTKEKAGLTSQLDQANADKTKLVAQIADLTVGNAFVTSKFVTEDLTLTANKARVIYGSHFEFKDGAVVAFDKPTGSSDRTALVDGSGIPLTFDAAMTKIIEGDTDRDQLLKSKAKPGSGNDAAAKAAAAAAAAAFAAAGNSVRVGGGLSKIAAGLAKGIGK